MSSTSSSSASSDAPPAPTHPLFDKFKEATSSFDGIFACGGSIPVHNVPEQPHDSTVSRSSSPVVIRWDSPLANHHANKVVLGIPSTTAQADSNNGSTQLEKLIHDCQPATFGFRGSDIFDQEYRNAVKLEESQFSTNFHPANFGITDALAQALVPLFDPYKEGARGVDAELYKLNVYSGPYGHFKPHVDTPRGRLHFASLVVCLPSAHEGGELLVRSRGKEVCYDWGPASDHMIQWAAFYSDCEHEVCNVLAGHRITLTYNLMISQGTGMLAGINAAINPARFPIYNIADEMLKDPNFMSGGGFIGFYCTHDYAHSTKIGVAQLPLCLKGLDMVLYEIFQRLRCPVKVLPIYKDSCDWHDDWYDDDDVDDDVTNIVGTQLREYQALNKMYDNDKRGVGEIMKDLRARPIGGIQWLNDRQHPSVAASYLAYGNNATVAYEYSHAALLIKIPHSSKRVQLSSENQSYKVDGETVGAVNGRANEWSDEGAEDGEEVARQAASRDSKYD